MEIIKKNNINCLVPAKGKFIRDINDVYVAPIYDEGGNLIKEEHIPYYTTIIYLAKQVDTLERAEKLYIEETIETQE